MDQLRLGVIGAGPIVEKKHLPALSEVPEIAVVALCRRTADPLDRLVDRFRIRKRYTDYRALLDQDDIDAVLIATGPEAQPQIVNDAAAARKHIFVEKPMAETSAEARRMADAVRAADLHFQVGFNKRFYSGYRRAWALIQRGELGPLSGIHARFWFQPGRRDPMLHNGVHFLDLAAFFAGPVRDVFARRCGVPARDPRAFAPETLAVSLRFESGAVGHLLLSSLASWDYPNESIDIVGSNHTALSIENGRQLRVFSPGDMPATRLYEQTLSVHWWSGNDEQGFVPQLRAFARAVLDGAAPAAGPDELRALSAGPEDGIRALLLLEAVQRSIAEGVNVSMTAQRELIATGGVA